MACVRPDPRRWRRRGLLLDVPFELPMISEQRSCRSADLFPRDNFGVTGNTSQLVALGELRPSIWLAYDRTRGAGGGVACFLPFHLNSQ
ncbi:MAG: hypothetical protein WD871_13280, partial [Xanthobacteraceae bacterium]